MKTNRFSPRVLHWSRHLLPLFLFTLVIAGLNSGLGVAAEADPSAPFIKAVQLESTNVVVVAQVPAGIRSVTLECRERLGPGGWEPRAVARLDGAGGEVRLRITRALSSEMIRVRADSTEPLPASFYTGTNEFYEAEGGATMGLGPGAPLDSRNDTTPNTGQTGTRDVVESDIWKIRGQTLYFFNQLRGLQVIDLSDPDAPVVRGTLELPAAGEDLYVLGDTHAVLLARPGCNYYESQVLVVAVDGGSPKVVGRLPVSGWIIESRLVGSALYVASQSYRPVAGTTNTTWEWGTLVSSFDLSDPAKAAARNTLWYAGYGNVVTATDRLLFVVTQNPTSWWQSMIRSIDITDPDGTMKAYESIRTAGWVRDKFKLRWEDGVLATISEDWRSTTTRRVTTVLETFRLPDPRAVGPAGVAKLGELELGRGEQLHATRFDGQRVYVVTFFRIDPLWVVDLSNPSTPRIAGSVDVPGWSTFIQPLGDRLVSIGIESNKVAVSLFNVANPAAPALLSRVRLGQNYSWSEANWDEKAFSVLPGAGLILVPFSGDTTNGYASSVQLIDLKTDSVVARGIINQRFQPRRATLYENRVLSISEWQLLSVDASDRDHPLLRSTTTLAWPVDRIFLHGGFVVEVGAVDGWGWLGGSLNPVLRVAPAASPNRVVSQLALSELPLLGAVERGDHLFLLQGQSGTIFYPPIPLAATPAENDKPPTTKILLTVVSLAELPSLRVEGKTEAETDLLNFVSDFQAVWPKPNTLVFAGSGYNFWRGCWLCPMPLVADVAIGGRPIFWPPYGGGGNGRLLAFNVGDPGAPAFASSVTLSSNQWWNFSPAFAAEGLVYLSHQTTQFIPIDQVDVPKEPAPAGAVVTPVIYPPGSWVARSYLDVVDYADAAQPLVRKPVNVPGRLTGISHRGAVIYTVGTHWKRDSVNAWTEFLDAGAYDGVSVHQIDSLALSNNWPRPLLIADGTIFLGQAFQISTSAGTSAGTLLETWRLSDAGKFTRIGSTRLETSTTALAMFDRLLAAQQANTSLLLFDATDASALRKVGQGDPAGCLYYDLGRADGALGRGVWIPLGAYGAARIEAEP